MMLRVTELLSFNFSLKFSNLSFTLVEIGRHDLRTTY